MDHLKGENNLQSTKWTDHPNGEIIYKKSTRWTDHLTGENNLVHKVDGSPKG